MEEGRAVSAGALKKFEQGEEAGKCEEAEDTGKKDECHSEALKHEICQLRQQIKSLENQLGSNSLEILDKENIINSLNKNLNYNLFTYNQQLEELRLANISLENENNRLKTLYDQEHSEKEIISYHLANSQKLQGTILENNVKISLDLNLSETKFKDLLSSSEKEKARLNSEYQFLLLKYDTAQEQLSKNFSIRVKNLEAELDFCKAENQRLINLLNASDPSAASPYEIELTKLEEFNSLLMQQNKELHNRLNEFSKLML